MATDHRSEPYPSNLFSTASHHKIHLKTVKDTTIPVFTLTGLWPGLNTLLFKLTFTHQFSTYKTHHFWGIISVIEPSYIVFPKPHNIMLANSNLVSCNYEKNRLEKEAGTELPTVATRYHRATSDACIQTDIFVILKQNSRVKLNSICTFTHSKTFYYKYKQMSAYVRAGKNKKAV